MIRAADLANRLGNICAARGKTPRWPIDLSVVDDGDGLPPRLASWDESVLGLTPTQPEVDAASNAVPADAARLIAIDATIASAVVFNTTVAQLKAMDNATFDTWWTNNVTSLATANQVLKLLARLCIRRLL